MGDYPEDERKEASTVQVTVEMPTSSSATNGADATEFASPTKGASAAGGHTISSSTASIADVGDTKSPVTPTPTAAQLAAMRHLQSERITLRFRNITKRLPVPDPIAKTVTDKTLVEGLSGEVRPGQIVALMGPSGSGKTTLLNILGGRALKGVTGSVTLNDQPYHKSMKQKIAYVMQEDIMHMMLTVRQQLEYTALLRLPRSMTKEEKLAQVESVITDLGLTKCAGNIIFLCSGGEKKRVNIATELLTNPSLILLDEPTSGLDSTTAVSLMKTLRELADKGKTIITSIHQPSSQVFMAFDSLVLLVDGKMCYTGSPKQSIHYFDKLGFPYPDGYNAADHVMDVVNGAPEVRKRLTDVYTAEHPAVDSAASAVPVDDAADSTLMQKTWPTTWGEQVGILYRRSNALSLMNLLSPLNALQCVGLAIISGLLWFRMDMVEKYVNDRSAFVFFVMTFWPFQCLFEGLMSFPFERAVMEKERASGSYRLSAYFVAKALSEAPTVLVLPTIFLIISYWMANINPSFVAFLGFLASELLCVLQAQSIGLLLGALFTDMRKAMVAATISLLSLMLVGGFFIKNLPFWLKWARFLSPFKFANDATLYFVFSGDYYLACDGSNIVKMCNSGDQGSFTNEAVHDLYGIDLSPGYNCLIMLLFFSAIRVLAYLALRFLKSANGRQ